MRYEVAGVMFGVTKVVLLEYQPYSKINEILEDNYGILRCEHISKIYGKGNTCVKALDDVSFRVEIGEFVSIIGPSGRENPHDYIF